MPLNRHTKTGEIVRDIPGSREADRKAASPDWESMTEDELAELRAKGDQAAARTGRRSG